VGNCHSSLSKVISGVPQGSVLGPLLFLLFINDLPSLFGDRMTVKMFADDVKIYTVVGDIDSNSVLQCGLDALFDWSLKCQTLGQIGPKSRSLCQKKLSKSFLATTAGSSMLQSVHDLG